MAAGDLVYGTRTVLANVARLDSDSANVATAFGEVDNSSTLALDYLIHIKIPISASATAGTYSLYMVESQDGSEWTDGIDPSGTDSDFADFIKDAVFIRAAPTIYDNSPSGARTNVEFHFRVGDYVTFPAKYFGFVCVNKSGQTVPSSGSDGDSMSIKIASA